MTKSYISYWTAANKRKDCADLLVRSDGSYFVALSQYGPVDTDSSSGQTMYTVSTNGGVTWSTPAVFQVTLSGAINTVSPMFFTYPDGSGIGCVFYSKKTATTSIEHYVKKSTDGGVTWGAATLILSGTAYFGQLNATARVYSGRIMYPVWWANDYAAYQAGTEDLKVFVYYSDDNGSTWNRSADLSISGVNLTEASLCQMGDGRLIMSIRCNQGSQYFSYSSDNGSTWSTPAASTLISPDAPALLFWGNGALHAIHNYQSAVVFRNRGYRTPLVISRSTDYGATWNKLLDVESSGTHEFSYPSVVIDGSNNLLLTYYDRVLIPDNNNQTQSLKFCKIAASEWII